MDTVVQGYQPLDLAQIQKALPKNIKKINTDKDLDAEVTELGQVLKDLGKYSSLSDFAHFFIIYSCRLEEEVRGVPENTGDRVPLRRRLLRPNQQDQRQFLHLVGQQARQCPQHLGKCSPSQYVAHGCPAWHPRPEQYFIGCRAWIQELTLNYVFTSRSTT
jgi:hypothetical protein